jgi:IS30 family transposase
VQAWKSALRPKSCLLAVQEKLQEIVTSKLLLDWSPEQISGWLKPHYPHDERMRVSHETIFRKAAKAGKTSRSVTPEMLMRF